MVWREGDGPGEESLENRVTWVQWLSLDVSSHVWVMRSGSRKDGAEREASVWNLI